LAPSSVGTTSAVNVPASPAIFDTLQVLTQQLQVVVRENENLRKENEILRRELEQQKEVIPPS
jgi:regulator of replication initiation timing